ncbi:MAG TPA: DNA-directed RNA polymerase subunit P [Candidatus Nanopusillus sp.]|nr:DNA-directed RNA polymerase subunit P [Candidatus Nanopusillus sp.]HIP89941.1 DNA-directed RNA polymerase subunit P [Candidatus Nanopusillus sp.]
MVEYLCITCKRKISHEMIRRTVKCPYCGGKILVKIRPPIIKVVKAI